jgi:DNA-binding PadR family transcriptional regulator
MGNRDYLGEFEHVVLLALARLGDGAYGASIHEEILGTTGRDVSIPAVYVTLKRLEKKGLVRCTVEVPEEGGRATRNYVLESLWRGARVGRPGWAK